MKSLNLISLSASVCLLTLAACAQNAPQHPEQRAAPTGNVLDHEKSNAGLVFSYDHQIPGDLNRSGSLTLNVSYPETAKNMSFELTGSNGVEIDPSSATHKMTGDSNGPKSWTVSYKPTEEGTGYVNVLATVFTPSGKTQTQAYSIPIQVGEPKSNASSKITTINGENVVIMEAEEEIIQ